MNSPSMMTAYGHTFGFSFEQWKGNPNSWLLSSLRAFSCMTRHLVRYSDVIMGAMAPQITSLTIVYSTVYSDADQRKHKSSAPLAFVRGIPRCPVKYPAQRTSKAENVSIWWRHHAMGSLWCKSSTLHWEVGDCFDWTMRTNVSHIEAEAKSLPFRRRYFQINFLDRKCMNYA